ncbi:hypothetical protein ASE38_01695 [Cellulomonas sp. Root930]|nr:hypothetical protein ASE38_01695 [Cellulomonas sp. Root930]
MPGTMGSVSNQAIFVLDQLSCPRHGWLSHAAVHEAAHAVFAIDLGIEFVDVSIDTPVNVIAAIESDDHAVAGGVRLVEEDPTVWVPARGDEALDLLLAGSLAERAAFDHYLNRGYEGDIRLWRIGTGQTREVDRAAIDPILSASVSRVERNVAQRWAAIRDVSRALTDGLNVQGGRYTNFDHPLALTSAQVREVLERMPVSTTEGGTGQT